MALSFGKNVRFPSFKLDHATPKAATGSRSAFGGKPAKTQTLTHDVVQLRFGKEAPKSLSYTIPGDEYLHNGNLAGQKINLPIDLDDIPMTDTGISKVLKDGRLIYAGIPIQGLAEKSNYPETAYLLLHKTLPTQLQLAEFNHKLSAMNNRALPAYVLTAMKNFPKQAHPMARLQTAVSLLGLSMDPNTDKRDQAIRMIAAMPTLIAADYRISHQLPVIPPRMDLPHTLNFLHMLGENPDSERTRYIAEVLDEILLLHADHDFNASTTAVRVTSSTLANLPASIPVGIAALSGPRHGGANEAVARLLNTIQEKAAQEQKPFKAVMEEWVKANTTYPGIGHREYMIEDPREVILRQVSQEAAQKLGDPEKWLERNTTYSEVVDQHLQQTKGKKLVHNVDFITGALFPLLNAATATKCLPIEMYTPIFAMARVAGWASHFIEQQAPGERIIRPIALYSGPTNVAYTPIDQRP